MSYCNLSMDLVLWGQQILGKLALFSSPLLTVKRQH